MQDDVPASAFYVLTGAFCTERRKTLGGVGDNAYLCSVIKIKHSINPFNTYNYEYKEEREREG